MSDEEEEEAPKLSTGDPSTLGTYLKFAQVFGPKAEKYIQDLIDKSPKKEKEIVMQHETQMIFLLASIASKPDDSSNS